MGKTVGGNKINKKKSTSPTKLVGSGGAGVHKINLNGAGGGGADLKSQHSASAFDLYLEEFLW